MCAKLAADFVDDFELIVDRAECALFEIDFNEMFGNVAKADERSIVDALSINISFFTIGAFNDGL